jgi:hypothetical protein
MSICDLMTNSAFLGQNTKGKSLDNQLNYITKVVSEAN